MTVAGHRYSRTKPADLQPPVQLGKGRVRNIVGIGHHSGQNDQHSQGKAEQDARNGRTAGFGWADFGHGAHGNV